MTTSARAPVTWSPSVVSIPRGLLRTAFALFALLLATNAFYGLFTGARPPEPDPDGKPVIVETVRATGRDSIVYIAAWLGLYGISGLIVMRRAWERGLDVRLALLLPFALFIIASATWSYTPGSSIVFCIMLAANILVAAALAELFSPADLLWLAARMITVLLIVSLVLLALDPRSMLSDPTRPGLLMSGEFFGVFSHKVHLGTFAAIAIVVNLAAAPSGASRLLRWGSVLIGLLCLVLSNSSSAVTEFAVAGGLLLAARLVPGHRRLVFRVAIVVAGLVAALLPFIDVGGIANLFGRTPTLTGRTDFWSLAPGYILERPFLGYSYNGFFDTDPFSRVWDLRATELYFNTPNFHNSVLDTTIAFGVVGLFAYLAILLTASEVHANPALGAGGLVLAAIIVMLTAGSATDFQFMRHNALPTVLLLYAFIVGGHRRAAPPPAADRTTPPDP